MEINKLQTIIELIKKGENLAFLIGSGCSIDSPSNLPNAKSIMKELIEFSCLESEFNPLMDLVRKDKVRFEKLIEILQDNFDKNLKILEFFSQCKIPNNNHLFIAQMIITGCDVFTTNFDNLIEEALIILCKDENRIKPIITLDDYKNIFTKENNSDTEFYTVYKLHGSINNIITKEDIRGSIIATLTSLGRSSQISNDFILPEPKLKIFESSIEERYLIIMGYSGSDDFDIIPSLINAKNIKGIIWIDHS
ncbi:MAG: SIR2 family protein, partial [Candidatus Lokiarchaeota archaeon]